jgi:hypothetical protein
MPKTNDNTGATAAGFSGIVEHAAPINDGRKLSELDPELNLDGTLIKGEHPDHPAGEEREYVPAPGAPEPIERDDEADDETGQPVDESVGERNDKQGVSAEHGVPAVRPEAEKEESSPGINSRTSSAKTSTTPGKTNKNR